MNILFWIPAAWGIGTVLSFVCRYANTMAWVIRYSGTYGTPQAGREAIQRTLRYRFLTAWLKMMITPPYLLYRALHHYSAFLKHQGTIERLKRQGWHVETRTGDDGQLAVYCEQHMPDATEEDAWAAIEQGKAIVEEGMKQ